ncbi:MAG: response regulator [bacterium]|nr:response regulator [bacterium]
MDKYINILFADNAIEEHIFFKEAINKTNIVGHKVTSVHDGIQLLDFLYRRGTYKNSREKLPDIIMLDLNMKGTDGLTLIKELKSDRELKDIPVYVLTSSSNITEMNNCREIGCSGYFAKQKSNNKLTAIIESVLEKESSHL